LPSTRALYADQVSRTQLPVPLIDAHARRVRDLRISITDRCNFRCTYCMPMEGMEWLPRDQLLTYEEIARIARVCVEQFGFESIRLRLDIDAPQASDEQLASLREKTERYCVVLQTLTDPPRIEIDAGG